MNDKGFSLVELLAVIAILGILSGIGITAVTRYQEKSKSQAFDTLIKSAKEAAEQYAMDHPSATSVNFDTLVSEGYLENAIDPRNTNSTCSGTVRINDDDEGVASKLKANGYTVDICCGSYMYQIGQDNVKHKTDVCEADFQIEKYIETNTDANCNESDLRNKKFWYYTMNPKSKVCSKNASGNYGACKDSQGNYPCRIYDYYRRQCSCNYSKTTNKFCSSQVIVPASDPGHTMKIRYFDNSNGIAACNSENPGSFNSYVTQVCTYGTYANNPYKGQNNVMVFHGYLFFKEQSVGFTDFQPYGSWFHDPLSTLDGNDYLNVRVTRAEDVDGQPNFEQGCRDMCVRFTEALSGHVSD